MFSRLELQSRPSNSLADITALEITGSQDVHFRWIADGNEYERRRAREEDDVLASHRKKPMLLRNWDFASTFAFASIVLCTWEMTLWTGGYIIYSGFPENIYIYGISFLATTCTFASLGELASIAPIAAAQYHWVFMLAPLSCRKILSYVTGWMMTVTWQMMVISNALSFAVAIQFVPPFIDNSSPLSSWQLAVVMCAAILLAALITSYLRLLLPVISTVFLMVHVLAFIGLIIVLSYQAPHGNPNDLDQMFHKSEDLLKSPFSALWSFGYMVTLFLGADAPLHLSEEIHDARKNVPRSMLLALVINGVLGLAIAIIAPFCLAGIDFDAAYAESPSLLWIPLVSQATGDIIGPTVIYFVIVVMQFAMITGSLTVCSRVTWAFARDFGLPGSGLLSRVHSKRRGPINAVTATSIIACLVCLVNIGSTIASGYIIDTVSSTMYLIFLLPTGLLLRHRLQGRITEEDPDLGSATSLDVGSGTLYWGPWRIRGWLGVFVNAISCLYLGIGFVLSFLPTAPRPSSEMFNYNFAILIGIVGLAAIYYYLHGKKTYLRSELDIIL